jgi:hypothetical protein
MDSVDRVSRAGSLAWLLTGLLFVALGVAYLVATGHRGWRSPACARFLSPSCISSGMTLARIMTTAAVVAAVGAALLVGRWAAVKYAGLAPVRQGPAVASGLVLVLAATILGTAIWIPALHVVWPGQDTPLAARAAGAIVCLAAIVVFAEPHWWRTREVA